MLVRMTQDHQIVGKVLRDGTRYDLPATLARALIAQGVATDGVPNAVLVTEPMVASDVRPPEVPAEAVLSPPEQKRAPKLEPAFPPPPERDRPRVALDDPTEAAGEDPPPVFVCPYCDKEYATERGMKNHWRYCKEKKGGG